MGTNRPWTWRSPCLKESRCGCSDHHTTSLRMSARADCALSACYPLLQPIKALAYWFRVCRSWAFGQVSSLPHQLPATKVKRTFFPTNLAFYWLLSSKQLAPTFDYSCASADLEQSEAHICRKYEGCLERSLTKVGHRGKSCNCYTK